MKTRSNMPLFVVECTDIKALRDDQINLLRCGDYLVKKTGKQNHAYKVTYKEDGVGMCLTYHDASCVETVSYDFTGGHWVYNSTDKADLPINVEDASFKPIYCHPLEIYKQNLIIVTALILNNDNTLIDTWNKLKTAIANFGNVGGSARLHCSGGYFSSSGTQIASEIVYNFSNEKYAIVVMNSEGVISNIDIGDTEGISVVDSVNKIN